MSGSFDVQVQSQRGVILRKTVPLLAITLVAGLQVGLAHHSASAVFDLSRIASYRGTLTELDWRNPHILAYLEVATEAGERELWSFEGPAPRTVRQGLVAEDIDRSDFEAAIGTVVTIEASPAWEHARFGLFRTMTLADGRKLTVCTGTSC